MVVCNCWTGLIVDWITGLDDHWTGRSLDWITGLDHWTGLLDYITGLTFEFKLCVPHDLQPIMC